MLKVAAKTFSVRPQSGSEGQSLTHAKVGRVYTALRTTVLLLEDEGGRVCIIASHFMTDRYPISNLLRTRAAAALGTSRERVLSFSSHNHTDALLARKPIPWDWPAPAACLRENQLTSEGLELIEKIQATVKALPGKLKPASPWWGVGQERRITYNRKGRRPDGTTYLMREEDRLLLGRDFSGDIDADAPVVAFVGEDGAPLCFLVQFAGHPTTCYHPEHPVVHGDFPHDACDRLSRAFGGVPVAFLQGCCGDLNSKGLVSMKPVREKVADAERFGRWLGDAYIATTRKLHRSTRNDLACAWATVRLPYRKVPPAPRLRRQLAEIDDFLDRCARGDLQALTCVGINTARAMSPRYRAALLEPVRAWTEWALSFHTKGRLDAAPRHAEVQIGAVRIGNIGIVGMACEPFSGIGRRIKEMCELPLAIPCGYMNDETIAYVPDKPNNGDQEYMSTWYRYTKSMLPYRNPAGDLLADAGVRLLKGLTGRERHGSKRRDGNRQRPHRPRKRPDR